MDPATCTVSETSVCIDDEDPSITYVGRWNTWNGTLFSNDTARWTEEVDTASYTFTGTSIVVYGWWSTRNMPSPNATFAFDEHLTVITQSKLSPSQNLPILLYSSPSLPQDEHTLTIVNHGGGILVLDSFKVVNGASAEVSAVSSQSSTPPPNTATASQTAAEPTSTSNTGEVGRSSSSSPSSLALTTTTDSTSSTEAASPVTAQTDASLSLPNIATSSPTSNLSVIPSSPSITSSAASSDSTSRMRSGLGVGTIAAIAIGSAALLALLGALFIFLMRRRSRVDVDAWLSEKLQDSASLQSNVPSSPPTPALMPLRRVPTRRSGEVGQGALDTLPGGVLRGDARTSEVSVETDGGIRLAGGPLGYPDLEEIDEGLLPRTLPPPYQHL